MPIIRATEKVDPIARALHFCCGAFVTGGLAAALACWGGGGRMGATARPIVLSFETIAWIALAAALVGGILAARSGDRFYEALSGR